MRYPKNLPKGGTIGFVAPSFGCNIEPYRSCFENAQRKFKGLGYQLKLGPNCYAGEGVGISNTPEKCAQELLEGYCAPESDVLISCGGGELMCEILSHIDFKRVKAAPPKWYMGYSDNTNFTYLLATICDTAAIYGPCAPAFGMEPWHPALEDAMGLLTGERTELKGYDKWERESLKNEANPLEPYHVTEPRKLRVYQDGKLFGDQERLSDVEAGNVSANGKTTVDAIAEVSGMPEIHMEGRLLGGCMDCLVTLLGTRFDHTREFIQRYKEDGIIWFLEACDLNVMAMSRALWNLMEAGWFEGAAGFIIGRPYHFDEPLMRLDRHGAVKRVLKDMGVPIVMDIDLGHLPPAIPIITGAIGRVEAKGNDFRISYELS